MNSKSHMGNHVASLYVKDVVRTPDAHDGRRACVPVPALFHENSSLGRPFARSHAPCPGNMSSFSAPFLSACSKVISFRMQVPPKVGFSPAHRRAAEHFPPLCRKYPCPSCPHGMVPERSLQNLLKCRFFHFIDNILKLHIYFKTILKIITILFNVGEAFFLHFS